MIGARFIRIAGRIIPIGKSAKLSSQSERFTKLSGLYAKKSVQKKAGADGFIASKSRLGRHFGRQLKKSSLHFASRSKQASTLSDIAMARANRAKKIDKVVDYAKNTDKKVVPWLGVGAASVTATLVAHKRKQK